MPAKLTAFLITLLFFIAGVIIIIRQTLQKSRIARKYGGAFVAKRSLFSPEERRQIKRINQRTIMYLILLQFAYLCISLFFS